MKIVLFTCFGRRESAHNLTRIIQESVVSICKYAFGTRPRSFV